MRKGRVSEGPERNLRLCREMYWHAYCDCKAIEEVARINRETGVDRYQKNDFGYLQEYYNV